MRCGLSWYKEIWTDGLHKFWSHLKGLVTKRGWQGGRTGESYNGMFLLQAAGDCRRTACNAAELSPPAAASCRRTAVKARQGLSLLQSVRLPGALIFLLGTGNTSLSLSLSLLTLYSLLSLSYYQYNTKSSIPKYFLHAVLCLYCVGSMM